MTPRLITFLHREHGSALLEISAAITTLIALLCGVMSCARIVYINSFVGYAAREGSRYAMVRGSSFSGTNCVVPSDSNCVAGNSDIRAAVTQITPAGIGTGSSLQVVPSWPGTTAAGGACFNTNGNNSPGCLVVVKVSYSTNLILPFLPGWNVNLTSQSAVTIEQ